MTDEIQLNPAEWDPQSTVYVFDPVLGDFHAAVARRRSRDLYELLDGPLGNVYSTGDLVRVELSDGELIVRERIS